MKFKSFLMKHIVSFVNVLALLMVINNVNSTCAWVMHQPKLPKEAEKFKK